MIALQIRPFCKVDTHVRGPAKDYEQVRIRDSERIAGEIDVRAQRRVQPVQTLVEVGARILLGLLAGGAAE